MHLLSSRFLFTCPDQSPLTRRSRVLFIAHLLPPSGSATNPVSLHQSIRNPTGDASPIDVGFQHAPKFRSSVLVEGSNYTSNLTFLHRKAAEQEVAKYALECISLKAIADQACSPAVNLQIRDPLVCKSILREFAFKSNRVVPTYKTICKEGTTTSPVYVSSHVFDGKTCTSEVSGSKRMAEQMAAHTAIRALLGSNSGNLFHEIVKSKEKHGSPSVSAKELSITKSLLPIAFQPESSSRKLSNIPDCILVTNFKSNNRAISPHVEGRCRLEIQHFEPMKRCNPCGSMTSPNTEEKCVTEMQKDESSKRIVNSFAAITKSNPGQCTSKTQNVESKKRSKSCARMTGTNAEIKHTIIGPQNLESNRRFNSCAKMTSPNTQGKHMSGPHENVESKIGFNSCVGMIGPNAERKHMSGPHENVESKRMFNSCTGMTGPNEEGKHISGPPNVESNRKFKSCDRLAGPSAEGKRIMDLKIWTHRKGSSHVLD